MDSPHADYHSIIYIFMSVDDWKSWYNLSMTCKLLYLASKDKRSITRKGRLIDKDNSLLNHPKTRRIILNNVSNELISKPEGRIYRINSDYHRYSISNISTIKNPCLRDLVHLGYDIKHLSWASDSNYCRIEMEDIRLYLQLITNDPKYNMCGFNIDLFDNIGIIPSQILDDMERLNNAEQITDKIDLDLLSIYTNREVDVCSALMKSPNLTIDDMVRIAEKYPAMDMLDASYFKNKITADDIINHPEICWNLSIPDKIQVSHLKLLSETSRSLYYNVGFNMLSYDNISYYEFISLLPAEYVATKRFYTSVNDGRDIFYTPLESFMATGKYTFDDMDIIIKHNDDVGKDSLYSAACMNRNFDPYDLAKREWDHLILLNPRIDIGFIKKNISHIGNFKYISKSPSISIHEILKERDIPWDMKSVSKRSDVTIDIVKKYKNIKWDFEALTSNDSITADDIINNTSLPWCWHNFG